MHTKVRKIARKQAPRLNILRSQRSEDHVRLIRNTKPKKTGQVLSIKEEIIETKA